MGAAATSAEPHEGVVAFQPLTLGREAVMLGRIQVGEISPTIGPNSRDPVCFRIQLPDASSHAWQPAHDVTEARRLAAIKINDWMNAAGVVPAGGCNG